jgi:spore coat protein U-like protein
MTRLLARAIVSATLFAGSALPAGAACTVSATPVAFGAYDVFQSTPSDSTGTITYLSGNNDKDIRITISPGSSGSFSPRTLRRGTETLAYNLFSDAARTQVWGDGAEGTWSYFFRNPQNNRDIVLTVYGRVPAAQDPAVGSYGDTVVVTLEY